MHRGAAAVVMLVLLGCAGGSQSDTPSTESRGANRPVASGTSSDSVVAESRPGVSSDADADELAVGATAPAVCVDQRPVVTARIGSVNTIVVPANAEYFDGDVEAAPAAACPGDMVSFVVSIVNVSEEPHVFSAGRGLVFYSGMMANWSVVPLGDLGVIVQPGERLDQTVAGTIPPVAPGTYRVGPEGAGFSGEITVLDPTAG